MVKFFLNLLDFLYKKKCYLCGNSFANSVLCEKCFDKIEFLPPQSVKNILGVEVYSATIYQKEVQKLVRGLKYHRKNELAFYLAKIMLEYLRQVKAVNGLEETKFLIIPVPLHKNRMKIRKYNQMSEIAKTMVKILAEDVSTNDEMLRVEERLLKRVRDTKPLYRLNLKEREANLQNAFEIDMNVYNGENLLVIDDILTTGSTLKEIFKTLQLINNASLSSNTTSPQPPKIFALTLSTIPGNL